MHANYTRIATQTENTKNFAWLSTKFCCLNRTLNCRASGWLKTGARLLRDHIFPRGWKRE